MLIFFQINIMFKFTIYKCLIRTKIIIIIIIFKTKFQNIKVPDFMLYNNNFKTSLLCVVEKKIVEY